MPLRVAIPIYKGKSLPDTLEVDESAFGVQLQIQKERFSFQAEYLMAKYDANIVRNEMKCHRMDFMFTALIWLLQILNLV